MTLIKVPVVGPAVEGSASGSMDDNNGVDGGKRFVAASCLRSANAVRCGAVRCGADCRYVLAGNTLWKGLGASGGTYALYLQRESVPTVGCRFERARTTCAGSRCAVGLSCVKPLGMKRAEEPTKHADDNV